MGNPKRENSMSKKSAKSGLVYSTDSGRMCPNCGQPLDRCACSQKSAPPQGDGIVRVSRESKGRKGKPVSLISGVALAEPALKELARELKQKCGSGGTINNGVIEIQGDHRDLLVGLLKEKGYQVKKAGG